MKRAIGLAITLAACTTPSPSPDATADAARDATSDHATMDAPDAPDAMDAPDSRVDAAMDAAVDDATHADAPRADTVCEAGATRACFTGALATRGVGACRDGVERCLADQSGWGPCDGEVTAIAERCATPDDEDCDSSAPLCEPLIARFFAGGAQQQAHAIAIDALGNVAVGGEFSGPLDLGEGPVVPDGTDAFVAIFSPTGALRSLRTMGGAGAQIVRALAFDASNNLFIAGSFTATLRSGSASFTSMGGSDAFVASLDSAANARWTRVFGGASDAQEATAIAVLATGAIAVGGRFAGTLSAGAPLVSAGATDAWIALVDNATGAPAQAARFGDGAAQELRGIAANSTRIAIAGVFSGSIDFNGAALTAAGAQAGFVAALPTTLGAALWARSIGGPQSATLAGVAVDRSDRVTVAGSFRGAVSAGVTLTSAGMDDIVVAQYDRDGLVQWSRRFGDASVDEALTIASDSSGELLLGGSFALSVDFGPHRFAVEALTAVGTRDAFLLRLASDGSSLWSRRFGTNVAVIEGVAFAPDRTIAAAGRFTNTLDLGTPATTATSADLFDAFMVRFPAP